MVGKGLESLIPKKEERNKNLPKKEAIFFVETEKIKPNPYQPRKTMNDDSLKDLALSIKKYGILQPLIVTKVEKSTPSGLVSEYQLVAGERRLRAAKMVGLPSVPVIIKEPTEKEKLEISIIENVQREDLNPIEKAEAFLRLSKEFNLSHSEIAKLIGVSREVVTNSLRLLKLPDEIKEAIKEGKISEGHGIALLMVQDQTAQKKLFSDLLKNQMPVKELEATARSFKKNKKEAKELLISLKTLEKELRENSKIPGLKVKKAKNKIEVILPFSSEEELRRFFRRIISE